MYLKYSKVIKTDKYVNTTIDCVQPTRVPTCFSLHSALKKILGAWLKRDYMDLFVPLTMINRNSYIPKKGPDSYPSLGPSPRCQPIPVEHVTIGDSHNGVVNVSYVSYKNL